MNEISVDTASAGEPIALAEPSGAPDTISTGAPSSSTPSAPSDGKGRRGSTPTAPPAEKLPDLATFAKEHARDLIKRGGKPHSGPPAAAPAATQPPAGPAPIDPATPATGTDVWSRLEEAAAAVSPELAADVKQGLAAIGGWYQQVEQYAASVHAEAQATAEQRQTLNAIAAHPTFKAAIEQVRRGGGGANANGPLPAMRDDQFETDTERVLYQHMQGLAAELAELKKGQGTVAATQEQLLQATREQDVARGQAEIQAVHTELDAQFPELAADEALRQAWHAEAANQIRIQQATTGRYNLRDALTKAGKLLHYDHAERRGASAALAKARKAGQSSTLREATRSQEAGAPMDEESLAEFGKRRVREAGLATA